MNPLDAEGLQKMLAQEQGLVLRLQMDKPPMKWQTMLWQVLLSAAGQLYLLLNKVDILRLFPMPEFAFYALVTLLAIVVPFGIEVGRRRRQSMYEQDVEALRSLRERVAKLASAAGSHQGFEKHTHGS